MSTQKAVSAWVPIPKRPPEALRSFQYPGSDRPCWRGEREREFDGIARVYIFVRATVDGPLIESPPLNTSE